MVRSFQSRFFYLLFIVLVSSAAMGQQSEGVGDGEVELFRVRLAEIGVEYVLPQNNFGDRMPNKAYGVGGALLIQTKPESATFLGLDANWSRFYGISTQFVDVVDGFSTTLDQRTKTNTIGVHFLARYYPFNNFPVIDPFVEGLVGVKTLFTATSLYILDTNESIDFGIDEWNSSFSFGFSAGFQMNVHKNLYYLSFKGSYLRGSSTGFYAIPDDLQGIPDLAIGDLDFRNAPIDLLRLQIGLSFAF